MERAMMIATQFTQHYYSQFDISRESTISLYVSICEWENPRAEFNSHDNYIFVWYCQGFWIHTTLYGSTAGCRSIQKTCAFWKNGLTFENTQSQLTYFCKSNINQTFTNGNGMILAHRRRSAILTCAPLTAMLKRLLKVRMWLSTVFVIIFLLDYTCIIVNNICEHPLKCLLIEKIQN